MKRSRKKALTNAAVLAAGASVLASGMAPAAAYADTLDTEQDTLDEDNLVLRDTADSDGVKIVNTDEEDEEDDEDADAVEEDSDDSDSEEEEDEELQENAKTKVNVAELASPSNLAKTEATESLVPENSLLATLKAKLQTLTQSSIGNLWPEGYGEGANLYSDGKGTKDAPYIIDSPEDLQAFATNIAQNVHNEGVYYKIESGTYDLNGSWIPVGFPQNKDGSYTAFRGHIYGDGPDNTIIKGLNMDSADVKAQESTGFFGELGDGATVEGFTVETTGTLAGSKNVGILAGRAVNATIRNVKVNGKVSGTENVGGLVGLSESSTSSSDVRNMIIEDVNAANVAVIGTGTDDDSVQECVGGIVGHAKNTTIMDVTVDTNQGAGNHIYGVKAYVGGVVGLQEHSDVLNSYVVSGEIGSNGDRNVGGITGAYDGGVLKVARFSANVTRPSSGQYNYGTFIGGRPGNAGFSYGDSGDISYLFADSFEDVGVGICGARAASDGKYAEDAHIGFWHSGDNYFSLVAGSVTDTKDTYFYQELEDGIMSIKKKASIKNTDTINHYTAGKNGEPVKGYLLTIKNPSVANHVASLLTAGVLDSSEHKPTVDGTVTGAFAEGDIIHVTFDDQTAETSGGGKLYFQMDNDKEPGGAYYTYKVYDPATQTYKEACEAIENNGGYSFEMPAADTTIGANYKSVGQNAELTPDSIVLELTEYRTGARENPSVEWKATAYDADNATGNASVITDGLGNKWQDIVLATKVAGATAQETAEKGYTYPTEQGVTGARKFWIQSSINEAINTSYKMNWAVSNENDSKVISDVTPGKNTTDTADGTLGYFTINLEDSAIKNKMDEWEAKQKSGGYKDTMTTTSPYYFKSVITSTMDASQSQQSTQPPVGTTSVIVKLNVVDNTRTSINGATLNRNNITYNVVRTLRGNRNDPEHIQTTYTINGQDTGSNAAQTTLHATFNPDYFTNNSVHWYLTENQDKETAVENDFDGVSSKDDGTLTIAPTGIGEGAYRDYTVTLKGMQTSSTSNSAIGGWVKAEDDAYTSQMKKNPGTAHTYTKSVKVTAVDGNNNMKTDTCLVTVNFQTVDQTEIAPTAMTFDTANFRNYNVRYIFDSNASGQVLSRTIREDDVDQTALTNGQGQKIEAHVEPDQYKDESQGYTPFDKRVGYRLALVNPDKTPNLNVDDVMRIDPESGQITVRGYNGASDQSDSGYSPWIQSLIKEGKLNGTTVPVRTIAYSLENNEVLAYHDVNVTFTAETINATDSLSFDNVVNYKNVETSLADAQDVSSAITAKDGWSGDGSLKVSASTTGTSEAPVFTVLNADKSGNDDAVTLADGDSAGEKTVQFNKNAQWVKDIIANRASGNSGSHLVYIKAKTSNGTPEKYTPVTLNFRYDGVDMTAETLTDLPSGFTGTTGVIANDAEETYDTAKGKVSDRDITLNVVATQGNYTIGNPETRKWSFGIVKLGNTTYTDKGVGHDDASYELSGTLAKYAQVKDGYLVPIKGQWDDLIRNGGENGSVSGVITAKKDSAGQTLTDSYKVTINFRYDKAVLDQHEVTVNAVYTQDSQTVGVKNHWTGDEAVQLHATIHDDNGHDVTPIWESSDESIATVNADGVVTINKDTWIKDIIDAAQSYSSDTKLPHSGSKTVTITAKRPSDSQVADTCTFTVNFRYDQVMLDKHEETWTLVKTQTSRTNNPSYVWSGNDTRHVNSRIYVAPGDADNAADWAVDDEKLLKVDTDGNITPLVDADWQTALQNDGKYEGYIKTYANAVSKNKAAKDSVNVLLNYKYEDVEMAENQKTLNITVTGSGPKSSPTYTITGDTSADVSAVLHSARDGETKVVYSSGTPSVFTMDSNTGKFNLVIPTVEQYNAKTKQNETVQAQGTDFQNKAPEILREAIKHAWADRDGARYITTRNYVMTAASEDGRMADQCNVTVNVKYIDNTYTRSSGGGGGSSSSSGGGGGSSASGATRSGTTTNKQTVPSGAVSGGTWTQTGDGKWLYTNGRVYTDEWAYVQNPYAEKGQEQASWFHFGKDSYMDAGWYTDPNGDTYLLNPNHDSTYGRMLTGWNWIDTDGDGIQECYYFETQSNGRRGRLYKNETTPDGLTVNSKGQWTNNGVVMTRQASAQQTSQSAAAQFPSYVITNPSWTQDKDGAWYLSVNGTSYRNRWAAVKVSGQNSYEWYHFDANGRMQTGWYHSTDGKWYYLEKGGSLQGRALRGWQWIDDNGDGTAECYYFDTATDGIHDGQLFQGTTTPDKYTVDSNGRWTVNGAVQTKHIA